MNTTNIIVLPVARKTAELIRAGLATFADIMRMSLSPARGGRA